MTVVALPWLASLPAAGGPLVALGAGLVGWGSARAAAASPAANDNAPRPAA